MNDEKTTVDVINAVTVQDLGGGVYRVDGALVASASKMIKAVSAKLGIEPVPRNRKEA